MAQPDVEGKRGGDEQTLMVDHDRGLAQAHRGHGGKRDHRIDRGAHRRPGRPHMAADIGDRVGEAVERGVGGDRRRRRRSPHFPAAARARHEQGRGDDPPMRRHYRADRGVGEAGAGGKGPYRAHIGLGEFMPVPPVRRSELHDHVILVEIVVDGRDLALPEPVIEVLVDRRGKQRKPRRGGAVIGEIDLIARLLLVRAHIGERWFAFEGGEDARRPGIELVGIDIGEGVLILGIAGPAAGADILDHLQIEPCPRDHRELAPQPVDHRLRRGIALAARLEGDEEKARIGLPPAGEGGDVLHCRVGTHDAGKLRHFLPHRLERNGLIADQGADQPPRILLREKSFGDRREQIEIQRHCRPQDTKGERRMAQHPPERAAIGRLEFQEKFPGGDAMGG